MVVILLLNKEESQLLRTEVTQPRFKINERKTKYMLAGTVAPRYQQNITTDVGALRWSNV